MHLGVGDISLGVGDMHHQLKVEKNLNLPFRPPALPGLSHVMLGAPCNCPPPLACCCPYMQHWIVAHMQHWIVAHMQHWIVAHLCNIGLLPICNIGVAHMQHWMQLQKNLPSCPPFSRGQSCHVGCGQSCIFPYITPATRQLPTSI